VRGFPGGGRQRAHPAHRPVAALRKDVPALCSEVAVPAPASFDEGSEGGDLRSGCRAAHVQPVLTSERQGSKRAFAPVVIDRPSAVLQIRFPPAPLSQRRVASLGPLAPRLDWLADFPPSSFQLGHAGHTLCRAQRQAGRGAQPSFPGLLFHGRQLAKPGQAFRGHRGQRRPFGRVHKASGPPGRIAARRARGSGRWSRPGGLGRAWLVGGPDPCF